MGGAGGGGATHPHRGHPELLRYVEVHREIVEEGSAGRVDREQVDEALVALGVRLRDQLTRQDVEGAVEEPGQAEPREGLFDVVRGAVGEDELPARQGRDRLGQERVGA